MNSGCHDLQESKFDEFTGAEDLHEGGTLITSSSDEFTSRLLISPTPRSGTLSTGASKILEWDEGVQVHLKTMLG